MAAESAARHPFDPTAPLGLAGAERRHMRLAASLAAIGALFAAPATAADIPAPDQRYYHNVDSQFSVRLLGGFLACVSEETNHGVVILLNPLTKCNDDYQKSRAIFVYAESNAAEEAPTATRLTAIECRWQRPRDIVWLKARISGRKAAGCRRDFPDDHI